MTQVMTSRGKGGAGTADPRSRLRRGSVAVREVDEDVPPGLGDLHARPERVPLVGEVLGVETPEEVLDADVQSAALKEEILASVSAARSVQVNGTPSFLVDGVAVIPGENGRQLLEAIRAKVAAAR